MKKTFHERLIELLKTDPRFLDEDGELIKAAVIDRAWKIDRELVKLILSKTQIKDKFFDEIEGHWIFNINTFVNYIADKNFLANSYTRFRNRIGLNIDGKFLKQRGEVSLVWPYKDCVLEGGQTKEEEKRKEILFNEILAQDEIDRLFDPKVLTAWKRYTPEGNKKVTEINRDESGIISENFIINGNNLLALHCLLTQFRGRINLIYIDPPFNTGNDSFHYNDNFNHSVWLTFMRNRLMAARDLLTKDGNIFIHIDINESHYLKVLCDEVFGMDNFLEEIIWAYGSPSGGRAAGAKPVNIHDYILHYTRDYSVRKQNKIYTPYSQKYISDWFKYKDNDGRKYQRRMRGRDENGKAVWAKQYLDESKGVPLTTVWTDIKQVYADPRAYKENQAQHSELVKGFSGQKPERLLQRIIEMTTDPGDIVLDYHIGTGTTCSVAHKMGRQYIGIEQLNYGTIDSVVRQSKVIGRKDKNSLLEDFTDFDKNGISKAVKWQGGGNFIYFELMKYNQVFMDKIQSAKTSNELVKVWKNIANNSFLNWYVNPEIPEDAVKDFKEIGKGENGFEKQKRRLAELLNKNQLYVNLSEIDDTQFKVSDYNKGLNRQFYGGTYAR
jgi:adenine-specific DNA-methyltransferase